MSKLLNNLAADFPNLVFQSSESFYWSPRKQTIHYSEEALESIVGTWSLLHELGHANLKHQTFTSDFELLSIEVSAWEQAKLLAKQYKIGIDEDHVQDCLDTYRDWLYLRSTCPQCRSCSQQMDSHTYNCFNCGTTWNVSRSRRCRSYRKKALLQAA